MPEDKFDPFKFLSQLFSREDKVAGKTSQKFSDSQRLLDSLESLTYTERVKRMCVLGKASVDLDSPSNTSAKRVLAELNNGDFCERYMALISCHGSRDGDLVFKAAKSDPSALIRAYAFKLVASICTDDQVLDVIRDQSEKTQRSLLKALRKRRRVALIDKFIETLLDGRASKITNAIFFGSADCVQKHLSIVSDRLNYQNISRFAYQHPKLALEYLTSLAQASTKLDPRLVSLSNQALSRLAESHPDACMKLLVLLKRTVPASYLQLGELFKHRTNELIDLLASSSELSVYDLGGVLRKMDASSLSKAIEANALKRWHYSWFSKLSLEARSRIYEYCSEGWRDQNGCLATIIIDKLPEEVRLREAKRHLALPSLAANMAQRLPYTKYLTWSEAIEMLQPVLDSSEVENRTIGFRCLMPILRFRRAHSKDLLEILLKRKNESDPVRLEILSGLSQLPPSIWKKDVLDSLSNIITAALSAADLSVTSLNCIGIFVMRLFRFHREWATEWIVKLARDRGAYYVVSTVNQFSLEELRFLGERLTPVVKYWESREEEAHLSAMARWYAHKLEEFPALIDALCSLCKTARSEAVSKGAAITLQQNATTRFNDLLPELLQQDGSWAEQRVVNQFLHYRRQDLLSPYLGQNSFKGRFSTGKTRIVPNFTDGFHRWTSKQQHIYANELSVMAQDKDGAVGNRIYGIHRLCLMPEPPIDVLRSLTDPTNVDDKSAVLRDFTINHLGDLDGGQGTQILLEAVHDQRARLAIYALRKSVLTMPADSAIKILEQVPSTKISVFKEVIRLVGELHSDAAYSWLIGQSQLNLHKDLQVALLRALWNYPDKDQTWVIMHQALDSGIASYVDTVIRMPADSLSLAGREHLLKLFHKALLCNDAQVRCKALLQAAYLPILDSKRILLEPLLKALSSNIPDEIHHACTTFFRLYPKQDREVMESALLSVVSNTRALVSFLSELESGLKRQREFLLTDATAILSKLRDYPKTISWQLRLAAAILPWPEFHEFLKALDNNGSLHCDALLAANSSFSSMEFRPDPKELEELETQLASEKSENLRRVALAILVTLGTSGSGWTTERLDRLRGYRTDASLMVSAAAEFTLPAVELQTVAV